VTRICLPVVFFTLLCGLLWGGQQPPPKDDKAQGAPQVQEEQAPPEEDETAVEPPKEYSFNPIQAEKELKIGNYYFKKGSYKAAANRFREASKWNPGFAEAYLRLGDAEEKRKDRKAAREAYAKFVELAPADKRADRIRKKLAAN
jgi:tetratricopeptide (TPR) repeat protein